jgi:GntR family transcriptional regulator/MocR family aminotransferase
LHQLQLALAEYLGRVRAVVADPERLFVSAGAAHGMEIVWRTLRERGATRIAVEDPVWPVIPATIRYAGLEVVAIAVDDHGLDVGALEDAGADAVVLSPAHQYPTGAVLAPRRRAQLVAWARRTGALIVEDDYDAEYRYDREPLASLQGLPPDCVVYVGSTSKTLAPGLRLGWVLVPSHLVGELGAHHAVGGSVPSVLMQAAYATLLQRGQIDRHLRRARLRYRARRNALMDALARRLPDASLAGAAAGLHLIAWLPDGSDELAISEAAARRGVAIHTLHLDCVVSAPRPPALILGYGVIVKSAIDRAVAELGRAAKQ